MRPGERSDRESSPQHRSSANGASQNGSSPVTNGSGHGEAANGDHTNGHSDGTGLLVRPDDPLFHGHDREEITRIILQSLSDLGYRGAAEQLSKESGYALEVPSVAEFRHAVLAGDWDKSETLLLGPAETIPSAHRHSFGNGSSSGARRKSSIRRISTSHPSRGLPLSPDADVASLRFLLRQQKYLELLERRDLNAALLVLRSELTPLKADIDRLHFLSSLMMCPTASDLRNQADWDGAQGQSRSQLLSEISASISPAVMIPEHRLTTLLSAVQDEQVINCRYHNTMAQPSLYTDHQCSPDDFPLHTLRELEDHHDEVWCVEFSHDGSMLASAGKDGLVCVYDTASWRLKHRFRESSSRSQASSSSSSSQMNRGVSYVAFSPDDRYLISCCSHNEFYVMDMQTGARVADGTHFDYPVTTAAWLPDSEMFVVGSLSASRPLGLYSLRDVGTHSSKPSTIEQERHSWREPHRGAVRGEANQQLRVTDCAINSTGTRLAASTTDRSIVVYNLDPAERYRKIDEWPMEDDLKSLNFSQDGELLVSMCDGRVFTMDIETGEYVSKYDGATSKYCVVRSAFGGAGEGFVISGSEDSHIYIWRRQTCIQVAALEAHGHGVVNDVAWHPTELAIFASAGDDRKVRIWSSRREMGDAYV